MVPDAAGRTMLDRVIFSELTLGRIEDRSRADVVSVIARLAAAGAQAVVLACTELELLVGDRDSPLPVIDSTRAHAMAAVEAALAA